MSAVEQGTISKIKIYCDSGADISGLKSIEYCEFYQFPYDSPHRPKKSLLLAKLSSVQWGDYYAAWREFTEIEDFKGSALYEQIKLIIGIGPENRRDVLHFDSAHKTGCEVFLTSDKGDIWSKRKALETLTGIKTYCMPLELEVVCEYLSNPGRS